MQTKVKISVQPQLFLIASLALLMIPLRWLFSWILAVTIHELFHYAALRIFKNQITSLQITTSGLKMNTGVLSGREEVISAIAGPLGSLVLVWLAKWMPTVGICAFVQLVYNLLPIRNFDGGRVMIVLFRKILGYRKGERLFIITERIVIFALLAVSAWFLIHRFFGIILLLCILIRIRRGKCTCKESKLRVQ